MRHPHRLLRPGFFEYAASGLVLQLAWSTLLAALSEVDWYRSGNASYAVGRVVWGLGTGLLIVMVAWRGSAYLRAPSRPAGTDRGVFAVPGAGLGAGLVLGEPLTLQATGATGADLLSPVPPSRPPTGSTAGPTACSPPARCSFCR